MSFADDLVAFVGVPAKPSPMRCSCGQKLRVSTGTWGKNGLPAAWALCAHCFDSAGERKVWCPFDGHIRVQATFKPGFNDSGREAPVASCQTGTCGYKHAEMMKDLDTFFHRGGSSDAWEAAEKWEERAVSGVTHDWESIQARQICRVRRFFRTANPALKAARQKARETGQPEPSMKALMEKAVML